MDVIDDDVVELVMPFRWRHNLTRFSKELYDSASVVDLTPLREAEGLELADELPGGAP